MAQTQIKGIRPALSQATEYVSLQHCASVASFYENKRLSSVFRLCSFSGHYLMIFLIFSAAALPAEEVPSFANKPITDIRIVANDPTIAASGSLSPGLCRLVTYSTRNRLIRGQIG